MYNADCIDGECTLVESGHYCGEAPSTGGATGNPIGGQRHVIAAAVRHVSARV